MIPEAKGGEVEGGTDVSIGVPYEVMVGRNKCHTLLAAAFVAGLVTVPLCLFVLCLYSILFTMAMPLVLVSYLVVRLLQLLTSGDAYYNAIRFKSLFGTQIMLTCLFFHSILLTLFSLLALKVSKMRSIRLYDLSIIHWIKLIWLLIGYYIASVAISLLIRLPSPPMLWQYERGINVVEAMAEISSYILWLTAIKVLLKTSMLPFMLHQVQGLATHKWIQVVIFIIIGIDTIAVSCNLITFSLHKFYKNLPLTLNVTSKTQYSVEELMGRKYAVYWCDGLRKNIVFILSSMFLLLSWNSYFRTHISASLEVASFVTMTFLSLLILSVLWLIKSCIILAWKANNVFDQLRPRLLENREELYFLGILDRHKFDILSLGRYSSPNPRASHISCRKFDIMSIFEEAAPHLVHSKLSKTVRDDLYMWMDKEDTQKEEQEDVKFGDQKIEYATLHDLQRMAQYFLQAHPTLSSRNYVRDMLHYLTTTADKNKSSLEQHLEHLIKNKTIRQVEGEITTTDDPQDKHEWKWFKHLVYKQTQRSSLKEMNKSCNSSSAEISKPGTSSSNEIIESCTSPSNATKQPHKIERESLKAWMENGRGTCMELANIVNSIEEVVNCLDNIMSTLLIGATFILWLLLTGLATTKILVLIASPLVGATFIFGDTCKTLFQGMMFVYVFHPFNVGDLVLIDDKMMVVKIVGLWKTIFEEIGKTGEVIYANSELANKKVINYKSDFDWNDCFEFSLRLLTSDEIEELRKAIEKNLSKEEKCSPNHISIEALATEENVKMVVHLKYNTDNQHSMTLYECLQEKHNLRSVFSIKIRNLLNEKTHKD